MNNPDIDEIIPCNGPWHNKQIFEFPANSPLTYLKGLQYVFFSKEAKYISKQKFTFGIDVLGSRQGSWLMRRARITKCFGVKGYAGGENLCHKWVDFKENRNVAIAGLAFLPLLGSKLDINPRPRIFLTKKEKLNAQSLWSGKGKRIKKIILAPGGGFKEKCWGDENFTRLCKLLLEEKSNRICLIGSDEDRSRIQINNNERVLNLCGTIDLRQSAAMVSEADFIISNSSVCMHLAGAFKVPSLILLGAWYNSAKLHYKQWGYPESIVSGKEIISYKNSITSVNTALKIVRQHFNIAND